MERAESEEAGRFVTERENEKETFSPEAKFRMLIIPALDILQNRIPTRKLEHQCQGLGEDMWILSLVAKVKLVKLIHPTDNGPIWSLNLSITSL